MRRRKSDLHARVNRNLPLEFDDVRLTSYAGLELLERYLRTRRFNQLVREAFADLPRGGDFGVVVTNFQLETGAPPRRRTRKHTVVPLLQSVQTLRFELFHRAALLVRPGGKTRLRMTDNLPTRQTFTRIANALASG